MWNDPVHFDFDKDDNLSGGVFVTAYDLNFPGTEFKPSEIILGGSNVLIHRLSIWDKVLSSDEVEVLFDGNALTQNTFNAETLNNQNGVWNNGDLSTLAGENLDLDFLHSVLIPDNAGRFVDQMAAKQGRSGAKIPTGMTAPCCSTANSTRTPAPSPLKGPRWASHKRTISPTCPL